MNAVEFDLNALTVEFKQAMQNLYGDRLASVILYGSYARGDFHAESDVDFMVVLRDKELNRLQELERTTDVLVQFLDKYDHLISLISTTEKVYNTSEFLFYRNVRRDGKVV